MKKSGFIEGKFQIRDHIHPYIVGTIIKSLKNLDVKFASHSNFVSAVSIAAKIRRFSSEHFIKKVQTHTFLLTKQRSTDDYLQSIEKVYNYHTNKKKKLNIALLAKEEADRRRGKS